MAEFRLVVKAPGYMNSVWSHHINKALFTLPAQRVFTRRSKIFTLGSCFAVEVRKVLKKKGIAVYPEFDKMPLQADRYRMGGLPDRENFNYYNTFSIEQELARAIGVWTPDEDDIWQIKDQWWESGECAFQDPYRRCVFGRTEGDLRKASSSLSEAVQAGVRNADGFLITLGLIEVWKKHNNHKVACMHPGYEFGGGESETYFHLSDYHENLENLEKIVSHLHQANPRAEIVFTVSPVPLGKTFTNNDVFTANMESKSLLRTAAAEVCRKHDHVHYFQSYDIANALRNIYVDDGRHVRPEVVSLIVNGFVDAFFAP